MTFITFPIRLLRPTERHHSSRTFVQHKWKSTFLEISRIKCIAAPVSVGWWRGCYCSCHIEELQLKWSSEVCPCCAVLIVFHSHTLQFTFTSSIGEITHQTFISLERDFHFALLFFLQRKRKKGLHPYKSIDHPSDDRGERKFTYVKNAY